MDRITDITENLKAVLLSIDELTVTPTGYVFYNTVSKVNVDDEAVIRGLSDFPVIDIIMDDGGEVILSGQQLAYRNSIGFTLRCGVANTVKQGLSPRREANIKMNEILSDVKFALSYNPTLNNTCDIVHIKSSSREYVDGNSANRAGDLLINIEIEYSQSRLNPSLNACV